MQAAARSAFLLPLLLALPFTAVGVERTGSGADLVAVEYEGTITEVFEAPPQYVVGDRIKGRLFVDRRLAQPRSDSSPNRVTYISFDPAFVGDFWPSSGDGFDRVDVSDEQSIPGIERPIDGFSVEDWSVSEGGSLDGRPRVHPQRSALRLSRRYRSRPELRAHVCRRRRAERGPERRIQVRQPWPVRVRIVRPRSAHGEAGPLLSPLTGARATAQGTTVTVAVSTLPRFLISTSALPTPMPVTRPVLLPTLNTSSFDDLHTVADSSVISCEQPSG